MCPLPIELVPMGKKEGTLMSRFISWASLLLLMSCASNIQLTAHGCNGAAQWFDDSLAPDFKIESKVWSGPGQKRIFIKDLLKKNKIKCEDVKSLSFVSQRYWDDVLSSLLPWWRRSTIILTGRTFSTGSGKTTIENDEEESDDDQEES